MSFYANVFDPKLVVGQIIAMQCLGYISLSALLWMFHEIFGTESDLAQVFTTRSLGWDSSDSAAATAAAVMNGLLIGVQLSFVVERAKKCLDFAVTFYFLHLVACWRYQGFPSDWRWWITNIGACILASVAGEYLCMKKELREINVNEFLSMRPVQRTETGSPPPSMHNNNIQRRPSSRPNSPDPMV